MIATDEISNAVEELEDIEQDVNQNDYLRRFCIGKASRIYRDPSSCEKYIICNGNKTISMKCPDNLRYNIMDDICDVADKVQCNAGISIYLILREVLTEENTGIFPLIHACIFNVYSI